MCNIFFKESLPKEKRTVFAYESVKADFMKVLGNRGFWELSLVIGFLFAAYFVFVSTTSFLYVLEFGVASNDFPKYQASLLASFAIGSLSCSFALGALEKKENQTYWITRFWCLHYWVCWFMFAFCQKILFG